MSDPTNAEIMRRLDDLAASTRDDLVEIKSAFGTFVPRELYDAKHEALRASVGELKTRIDQGEERTRALTRWIVGGIVVPIVLFVLQAWLNTKGGGA